MGFRPKPGSVLFSPSLDLILRIQDAFRHVDLTKTIILGEEEEPPQRFTQRNCPHCNGWVLNGEKWVSYRKTKMDICITCGTDYGRLAK